MAIIKNILKRLFRKPQSELHLRYQLLLNAQEVMSQKSNDGSLRHWKEDGDENRDSFIPSRPQFLSNNKPVVGFSRAEVLDALMENQNDFESAIKTLEGNISKRIEEERHYAEWKRKFEKRHNCPRCGSERFIIQRLSGIGAEKPKGYQFSCHYCNLKVGISEFNKVKKSKLKDFMRKEEKQYFDPVASNFITGNRCGTWMWREQIRQNNESILKYLRHHLFRKNNQWFSYQDLLNSLDEEYEKDIVRKSLKEDYIFGRVPHSDINYGNYLEIDSRSRKFRFLKQPFKYSVQKNVSLNRLKKSDFSPFNSWATFSK